MNWLQSYMNYTHRHEAPSMFHLWIGLSLISTALGKKCHLNKGYYVLYPNLFVVLVAGSARCRKTSAIDIGKSILDGIDCIQTIGVRTGSREKLLYQLANKAESRHSTFICTDELSLLLSKDQAGGKIMDDLTVLFNCPTTYEYDTFSHDKQTIKEPYITILTGTQPDAIDRIMPDLAVGGGYMSRNILVYQRDTEKKRQDFQQLTKEEIELKNLLSEGLLKISSLKREFRLSEEAREYYDEWYRNITGPEDSKLDGFVSRKHDHMLKISMLICVSDNCGTEITKKHLDASIAAIDTIQSLMLHALSGIGSNTSLKNIADKIIRLLEHFKRMSYSDLLKRCYSLCDSKTFKEVMETLLQSNLIHYGKDNHSMFYPGPREKDD